MSTVTRVDMHCHSTASAVSRLGVQRAVGLPECATPPAEVYDLAKRRGMDFVTITDHDTISGALEIADLRDTFISEELTASFKGEAQAVHVLCYGITPDDHVWLQAHRSDVERCATYLHEMQITAALAHPFYAVRAPLCARHLRRLADMFAVWEVRNGSRASELNRPAATYITSHDGIGIGGSDDHAGVDVGRTWTESDPFDTPEEFLAAVRRGDVRDRGAHGSAAKWAHAAIALAARALGSGGPQSGAPDPRAVLTMVQRVLTEGDAREGTIGADLSPADARALLCSWLTAVELDHLEAPGLIGLMQAEEFTHASLQRRANRAHERRLRRAVHLAVRTSLEGGDAVALAGALFEGRIAAIPYAPAAAFLSRERRKLDAREDETPRVAILADGIGSTHGVTRTIEEIRQRGVRGFEIEVIGTDPSVDRRLAAVAEIEVPFYPGLQIGVPSVPAVVDALTDGDFDVVHVCSPGPIGVAAAMLTRVMGLPLLGSYHTELSAYTELRCGDPRLTKAMSLAVRSFYGACQLVLSPSRASDEALTSIGVGAERVARWDRGVDTERFDPALRDPQLLAGEINVLYAGRVTCEKGVDLLADAFELAHHRDPRLRLVLAGGGPEQERLRTRLGDGVELLGWLDGIDLARAYASADVLLFPSRTDTFGQVILEAQASGLPVVAVAEGGPLSLIEDRHTGLLCEPRAQALCDAVIELVESPLLRERLTLAGRAAARERTWSRALDRLAAGYRRVLSGGRVAPDGVSGHPPARDLPPTARLARAA
jgi:glycosyltransferase involved in cell wall biosynthesis/predicted metal-dependent phosphoesterase TrpH